MSDLRINTGSEHDSEHNHNHDHDHNHGHDHGHGKGGGHGMGGGGGRNNGGGYGVGGYCICAKCGAKVAHQQGVKCTTLKCPACGHTMIREELLNEKKKK